jgi:ATP-dependent Clp protease ATP-binding subunit ClpX
MKTSNEKIPNIKDLEKEIGDFLTRKFGNNIKVVNPLTERDELGTTEGKQKKPSDSQLNFDLKPENLIGYLDQFVVKQDMAKAILCTKICTHFNRIKHSRSLNDEMVGNIKNNVLMIGPTGVGKTYIIKLIAKKIGVPFVKGDATKFSETGYVGGDVEDLVRDLVREADGDISLAQYGIIYIDEIDKIASSHNIIGADVSRTGVQRALLKPLEETEVDLKVPHDPISMIQEMERFRKTGDRDRQTINTKHILFIVSGAFGELNQIVKKRMTDREIGFGANIHTTKNTEEILKHIKSEDLMAFGFESEFVGRLPVRAIFERLSGDDLYDILKNPNNPIILGKKLDFAAYGIDVKFDDTALKRIAEQAFEENTGARGLVSAVEKSLLLFETRLPSMNVDEFPVTEDVIKAPEKAFDILFSPQGDAGRKKIFNSIHQKEIGSIKTYLSEHAIKFSDKYNLVLTGRRKDLIARHYSGGVMTVGNAVGHVKTVYDKIKRIELHFFENHDINIIFEEDAVDLIMEQIISGKTDSEETYRRISSDFEYGLKLLREKTNKTRFFISGDALMNPEKYISKMIKDNINAHELAAPKQEDIQRKDL